MKGNALVIEEETFRRNMLDTRFFNNLVLGKTDAVYSRGFIFIYLELGPSKQIFEISTCRKNIYETTLFKEPFV